MHFDLNRKNHHVRIHPPGEMGGEHAFRSIRKKKAGYRQFKQKYAGTVECRTERGVLRERKGGQSRETSTTPPSQPKGGDLHCLDVKTPKTYVKRSG